ncbi:MAG: hypothetical protein V4635_13555 [Bacteroidota bacterium]
MKKLIYILPFLIIACAPSAEDKERESKRRSDSTRYSDSIMSQPDVAAITEDSAIRASMQTQEAIKQAETRALEKPKRETN